MIGIDIDAAQIVTAAEDHAAADGAIVAHGRVAIGSGRMMTARLARYHDFLRRKPHEADEGRTRRFAAVTAKAIASRFGGAARLIAQRAAKAAAGNHLFRHALTNIRSSVPM